jgi:hypothetical protein
MLKQICCDKIILLVLSSTNMFGASFLCGTEFVTISPLQPAIIRHVEMHHFPKNLQNTACWFIPEA